MKLNIFKVLKPFVLKYEPEILMAMGLSGMIFSLVWGVKATVKATHLIDSKKLEENKDHLTAGEVIKETWKLYLPAAVSTLVSIPCIILGNHVSSRRNMALAAAYTISETALENYQEKTKEIVGEKKAAEIHEGLSKDLINKTAPGSTVVVTGDGDSVFLETITGRYFKSNWNKVLKAANELNSDALTGFSGDITLSDWFDKLGLDPTDISDQMGWVVMNGKDGLIDISIDSSLTPENIPCGAIHYNKLPKPF